MKETRERSQGGSEIWSGPRAGYASSLRDASGYVYELGSSSHLSVPQIPHQPTKEITLSLGFKRRGGKGFLPSMVNAGRGGRSLKLGLGPGKRREKKQKPREILEDGIQKTKSSRLMCLWPLLSLPS